MLSIPRMTDERFNAWEISDEAGELTLGETRTNSVAELWFALCAEREYTGELEKFITQLATHHPHLVPRELLRPNGETK